MRIFEKKNNIHTVAKLAGVSEMTVTRALNGHEYVSETTRKKVLAAAAQLQYRPNALAKSLRNGSTKSVGFIVNNGASPTYREVAAKLMKHGFVSYMIDCAYNHKAIENALNEFLGRQVDAVVSPYYDLKAFQINIDNLRKQKNLIITYNMPEELPFEQDSFLSDDRPAYRRIFRHALACGKKYFYYIGRHDFPSTHSWMKVAAEFEIDIEKYFIDSSACHTGGDYHDYIALTHKLMREASPRPEVIFTHEDIAAAQICRALMTEGISIPDEIQVVGYSNSTWSKVFSPSLTSISSNFEANSQCIFDLLMNRIRRPSSPFRHETNDSIPFFRDSTGEERIKNPK